VGGLAPGLGPVGGSPGPLRGHASRLRSFWGGCWSEPVAVSRAMATGLEKRVLDGVNTRPLAGSGCGSFCRGPLHWIRGWGLSMGSIPGAAHW
jgi:hypothetical protein